MTWRVGLDLVEIAAVGAALEAQPDRYAARVYSDAERDECRTEAGIDPALLARCFAAKEAALKALDWGSRPVPWRAIELRSGTLRLSGAAAARAADLGLSAWSVTTTRQIGYASALVLAMEGDRR